MFLFDDMTREARAYHESETNCEEALRLLRKTNITKIGFERARPGARLAPAVHVLRKAFGFDIGGDGSKRDPYFLLNRKQWPQLAPVTEAMKSAYYDTSHWANIRDQRYEHDGYRCVLCVGSNDDDLQCHHICYEIFNEQLIDLMTVCEWHHDRIHANSNLAFPMGIDLKYADRLAGYVEFPEWVKP